MSAMSNIPRPLPPLLYEQVMRGYDMARGLPAACMNADEEPAAHKTRAQTDAEQQRFYSEDTMSARHPSLRRYTGD